MKIVELKAYPTSFPLPPEGSVTLRIGRAVKRDAVVVKVTTDDGIVGWGESHHGRAPGAVAHLVNTTLRRSCSAWTRPIWSACGRGSTSCSSAATAWEAPRPSP